MKYFFVKGIVRKLFESIVFSLLSMQNLNIRRSILLKIYLKADFGSIYAFQFKTNEKEVL